MYKRAYLEIRLAAAFARQREIEREIEGEEEP